MPELGQGITEVLLTQGDRGEEVRDLQQRLEQLGYDPGPLDGIYGPRTADALMQFQASVYLEVTGDLNQLTWDVLQAIIRQTEVPETVVSTADILREPAAAATSAPGVTTTPPAAPPPVPRSSGILGTLESLVQRIANQVGVDSFLVLSMVGAESSFDPRAHNLITGAKGLMQLTPIAIQDLAQRFGVRITDPYDPEQNVLGGTTLLKSLLGRFGADVAKAIAAYHAGADRVLDWIRRKGADWLSAAGRATASYVQKVLTTFQAARGGAGASVVLASYAEPAPGSLPALFQPEVQTLTEAFENFDLADVFAGILPAPSATATAADSRSNIAFVAVGAAVVLGALWAGQAAARRRISIA